MAERQQASHPINDDATLLAIGLVSPPWRQQELYFLYRRLLRGLPPIPAWAGDNTNNAGISILLVGHGGAGHAGPLLH